LEWSGLKKAINQLGDPLINDNVSPFTITTEDKSVDSNLSRKAQCKLEDEEVDIVLTCSSLCSNIPLRIENYGAIVD